MKTTVLTALLAALLPIVGTAQETIPTILQKAESANPGNPDYRFLWRTDPGVRYHLKTSDNLSTWTDVPGYPKEAEGPVEYHDLTPVPGGKQFVQAIRLDEQAPVIVRRYPDEAQRGVPRFADLVIELEDFTGIDPSSISLTIGGGSPVTLADGNGLTFADGTLSYDVVDFAHGAFGETVPVLLAIADTLGNATTHQWSFVLEPEPQVEAGVFVFGSAAAQKAGQRLTATQGVVAKAVVGEVRLPANDGNEWTVSSVTEDQVVISYTGATGPAFSVDQAICNSAPGTPEQIFYRRITAILEDAATKKTTLTTQTISPLDLIEQGSISTGEHSVFFDVDATGNLVASPGGGQELKYFRHTFEPFGESLDGDVHYNKDGITISTPKAHAWLTPTLELAGVVENKELKFANIKASAQLDIELECQIEASLSAKRPFNAKIYENSNYAVVATAGVIPVWLKFEVLLHVRGTVEGSGTITATTGYEYNNGATPFSIEMDYNTYHPDGPGPRWTKSGRIGSFEEKPLTVVVDADAKATVELVPELRILLMSVAGVSGTLSAGLTLEGEGNYTWPDNVSSAEWRLSSSGAADFGFRLGDSEIGRRSSFELFSSKIWRFPPVPQLTILTHPSSLVVNYNSPLEQGTASFTCGAASTGGGLTYEWFRSGNAIPGATGSTYSIYGVRPQHAGAYTCKVSAGGQNLMSNAAVLTVTGYGTDITEDFALIPAGNFEMGDSFGEGDSDELSVHSVFVSAFYIAKYETTTELWDEVWAWGLSNGYTDLPAGSASSGGYGSKGENHPVYHVSWYDVVKWCNARSQKDGLIPCYTLGGAVFKTGTDSSVVCNFAATGYRLPTEAEWEKAARGGLHDRRFPWGDTISHSQANYTSSSSYSYDTSATLGRHPAYNDGFSPYSSQVGSFAPNGYGLYDMAGNMWEWCWDWYGGGYYGTSPASDPRGPTSGAYRVFRGGSWSSVAGGCLTAVRGRGRSHIRDFDLGFRTARSSVPQ